MTELILALKQELLARIPNDPQQPKDYETFVCNQLLSLNNYYQEQFYQHLQTWMKDNHQSVVAAIKSKQTNQIRPKLQLIYTAAANQQNNIKSLIDEIGQLLIRQQFNFQDESESTHKEKDKKSISQSKQINLETTQPFAWQKNKNRSLSTGLNPRRKLSKSSCFAEAKKLDTTTNNNVQTVPQFYSKGSQKIKKTKKRDDNCFDYLQKCMSSTSPSNFMLNYLAKTDNQEESNSYRQYRQPTNRIQNKKEITQPQIIVKIPQQQQSQLYVSSKGEEREIRESATYQKIMINFEGKISQKLDQLMSKYTQIQQKLQQSEKNKMTHLNQSSEISQQQQLIIPSNPYHPLNHVPQNVPLEQNESKLTYIDHESSKKQLKPHQKQNKTDIQKNMTRPISKTIHSKTKIIRNKTEQSQQDTSMEVITLNPLSTKQETDLTNTDKASHSSKKETIKEKTVQYPKKQEKTQIQKDKQHIQSQIIEYHQVTTKVLLPISKQLLHVLKNKYTTFCQSNKLPPNSDILSFESQPVKDQSADMKNFLNKMQKILNLNCTPEKKEKLLLYTNSFLNCYLSFSKDCSTIIPTDSKCEQNDIKDKLNKAIAFFSQ